MTDSILQSVNLTCVETVDEAAEFMRWLGERRPNDRVAVDSETTGLDVFHDRVRLVQFGDAHRGWTIPWDDWAGVAREAFRRYDGRYLFHNGPAR